MQPCGIWSAPVLLRRLACLPQGSSQNIRKRGSPDAYTTAPPAIRAKLKKQRCELPETQQWEQARLNVVASRFGERALSDWSSLCIALDGSTGVLIFWGKSAPCPAEFHSGWALQSHFPPREAFTCARRSPRNSRR
jgi:hypothetical protein